MQFSNSTGSNSGGASGSSDGLLLDERTRGRVLQFIWDGDVHVILLIDAILDATASKTLDSLLNSEFEAMGRINISSPSIVMRHGLSLCLNEFLLNTSSRSSLLLNSG